MSYKVSIEMRKGDVLEVTGNLVSFNCSENLRGSEMEVMPGYIEQNAEIRFFDKNSVFRDLLKNNTSNFFKGLKVSIFAGEHNLGTYAIDTINASVEETEVLINCIDYTYAFGNISVPSSPLFTTLTASQALNYIFKNALMGEYYETIDQTTRDMLYEIKATEVFFERKSVRECLNDVCIFGGVNMFYNSGRFVIARCY